MRKFALTSVIIATGALAGAHGALAGPPSPAAASVEQRIESATLPTATDRDRVDEAVSEGAAEIRELVSQAASDPSLAAALLDEASLTVTSSEGGELAPAGPAPIGVASVLGLGALFALTSGCRGPISQRTAIGFPGVEIAWRKVTVNPFCWNGTRLTSADAYENKWTGVAWCWKDQGAYKAWLIRPTRQKYVSRGTMASITPWGCGGGQQTISPKVHYERGGGWNGYISD